MQTGKKKFYITTPIYYVTAKPHLGSLYSTLIADVAAVWRRMQGQDVLFVTGTDEHGQKIARAAQAAGTSPKAFVQACAAEYKKLWNVYGITHDRFIRTTDSSHKRAVQALIRTLIDRGDIYKSFYSGWYCTPCETFITQKEDNAPDAVTCSSCNREAAAVSEETYFFALSKYQERLLSFYQDNPHFVIPKNRYTEIIRFVASGLKDLSISRTTVSWGVPFPSNSDHVVYVWADALVNYISAVGYGERDRADEYAYWWPADVHVLGKDIIRFHGVYWPAFLLAAGCKPPKQLLVHGWINYENEKMSKSKGNVVDPEKLSQTYGVDEIRYYLMRTMPLASDNNFSITAVEQTITADLANALGNLVSRLTKFAGKYRVKVLASVQLKEHTALQLQKALREMEVQYELYMEHFEYHKALTLICKAVAQLNGYFHDAAPWILAKKGETEAWSEVLYVTGCGLQIVALLLAPFMPKKSSEIYACVSKETFSFSRLKNVWSDACAFQERTPLFQKFEIKETKQEASKERIKMPKKGAIPPITIDAFFKMHLVVGHITACELIEKSDKLLKLMVDCGTYGMRSIVSGIKKHYHPEQLVGQNALFVLNLPDRTLFGHCSQGMILTATDQEGKVICLTLPSTVAPGTRLQ